MCDEIDLEGLDLFFLVDHVPLKMVHDEVLPKGEKWFLLEIQGLVFEALVSETSRGQSKLQNQWLL